MNEFVSIYQDEITKIHTEWRL